MRKIIKSLGLKLFSYSVRTLKRFRLALGWRKLNCVPQHMLQAMNLIYLHAVLLVESNAMMI